MISNEHGGRTQEVKPDSAGSPPPPLSSSSAPLPRSSGLVCSACGAPARRAAARFCATCGRRLDCSGYLPADVIRSSYHQHHQSKNIGSKSLTRDLMTTTRHHDHHHHYHHVRESSVTAGSINNAAATGTALLSYALVPYLGILFCPGAILMCSLAVLRAHRELPGQRRQAALSIMTGLVILGAQLLLWWALYKIPEWTGGF